MPVMIQTHNINNNINVLEYYTNRKLKTNFVESAPTVPMIRLKTLHNKA